MGWVEGGELGKRQWKGCFGGRDFVATKTHEECCERLVRETGARREDLVNGTCKLDTPALPAVPEPEPLLPEPLLPDPVNPELQDPVPNVDGPGRKLLQQAAISGLNFSDPGWTDPYMLEPNRERLAVDVVERRFDSNSSYDDMAWAAAWLFKATGSSGEDELGGGGCTGDPAVHGWGGVVGWGVCAGWGEGVGVGG